jgi:hypothetical protein
MYLFLILHHVSVSYVVVATFASIPVLRPLSKFPPLHIHIQQFGYYPVDVNIYVISLVFCFITAKNRNMVSARICVKMFR